MVTTHKGRGAVSNQAGRYSPSQSEWEVDCSPVAPDTVFYRESAKTIVTRNRSPDVPFEFSINPYRGCEHGCIYCFARPNHAYVDLSPGLDFETRIFVKDNAAEILERTFLKRGYRASPITLGTATDPYQPVEKVRRISRSLIELMVKYRHPFSLITKSALVRRDADLLQQAAALGLVKVMISVTTLDNEVKSRLEPRAASGEARLRTIKALTDVGIPVGVLMAPLIPWINDSEIEAIVQRSAEVGAESINFILLRLPLEVAPLFQEWLQVHYPDRADKVLNSIRQSRGGALNDPRFGNRMRGSGPVAELLSTRFRLACRRAGIESGSHRELDSSQFSLPRQNNQLTLF